MISTSLLEESDKNVPLIFSFFEWWNKCNVNKKAVFLKFRNLRRDYKKLTCILIDMNPYVFLGFNPSLLPVIWVFPIVSIVQILFQGILKT